MAADMLSNIDHWCMIKREDDNSRSGSNNKFTQKKLFLITHRRVYLSLVTLSVLTLELFYKNWHDFVRYHIPSKVESKIGHLLNIPIPDGLNSINDNNNNNVRSVDQGRNMSRNTTTIIIIIIIFKLLLLF